MSLTFGVLWGSEMESFEKPKRNSTEEKLAQSQYNGTRINMIHRDRDTHLWWITSNAENPWAFTGGPYLMLFCISLVSQKLSGWLKQVASILGCHGNGRVPRSHSWPFSSIPTKDPLEFKPPLRSQDSVFLRIRVIPHCLPVAQLLSWRGLDGLLNQVVPPYIVFALLYFILYRFLPYSQR